ncbi:MAG: hypothetical protein GX021_10140 [Tissierellia bacterium]|nr:hypothetical protein [Tissierellia bacterium]
MDTANTNETEKRGHKSRFIIILLIVLLLIPFGILAFLYNNNQTFKKNANDILTKMPGPVGKYFANIPTEMERNEKIQYLSKYYLELDPNSAAEKIYIVKKDDEKLYIDLIKSMNSISVTKTEEIVNRIRNMELRKDLLFSVYEEVLKEEEEKLLSEVSRFESQDIILSISEIENNYSNREFLRVLEEVNINTLGEVLYYIDTDLRDYILSSFNHNRRSDIIGIINKRSNEAIELEELAKVYETKSVELAIDLLGNTDSYSMEELAIIYSNLSILKSSKILSNIEDEGFIQDLFSSIIRYEGLIKSEENITQKISKGIEFFKEYYEKINNLVMIYDKMTPEKVAKIVENMVGNTNAITAIELEAENILELTDRDIIIDVLSKLRKQNQSKILDLLETETATQVTRLLARPN